MRFNAAAELPALSSFSKKKLKEIVVAGWGKVMDDTLMRWSYYIAYELSTNDHANLEDLYRAALARVEVSDSRTSKRDFCAVFEVVLAQISH